MNTKFDILIFYYEQLNVSIPKEKKQFCLRSSAHTQSKANGILICWWGFSSTSRFHDIVSTGIKGETSHPERRLLPARYPTGMRSDTRVSLPSSSPTTIYLPFPFASIHRTGKLFHRGGSLGESFCHRVSLVTDCAIPTNRGDKRPILTSLSIT